VFQTRVLYIHEVHPAPQMCWVRLQWPLTPTNAANTRPKERKYARVRDRAPLSMRVVHDAADSLAQLEPYVRMKPLILARLPRPRENECSNCAQCSFSQPVPPRPASLKDSCGWDSMQRHDRGRAAADVHEMGHRCCKRIPLAAAALERMILMTSTCLPRRLNLVGTAAGEESAQGQLG
jgi:hypothetical protein